MKNRAIKDIGTKNGEIKNGEIKNNERKNDEGKNNETKKNEIKNTEGKSDETANSGKKNRRIKTSRTKCSKKKKKHSTRTPEIFQAEACECGAAALSMLLRYYGCELPMEQLRYECGVSRDGCNAANLIRAGQRYGLTGKGYRVSTESLKEVPVPCILHWNNDHFIVLEKIKKKYAYINDPASGHRKVSKQELETSFSGIVLVFAPNENFRVQRQPSGLRTLIRSRLGSDREGVAYMVLAGILLAFPGILIPLLTQSFVDNVLQSSAMHTKVIVLALACLYALQIAFITMRAHVLARLRLKMSVISADHLLNKLFRLPVLFYEQRYIGELSRRIEVNGEINNFLAGRFVETLLNAFTALAYLIVMLLYSVPLTVIGLAGVALSSVVSFFMLRPIEELNTKKEQERCRMTGVLCAGISASGTIKAGGIENDYAAEVLGNYARLTESEQKLGLTQQIVGVLPGACSNICMVLILSIGGLLVMRGNITIGVLVAFSQLLTSFVAPVNSIISFSESVQAMKAGFSQIEDIESAEPDVRFAKREEEGEDCIWRKLSGRVDISDISFGYNPLADPVVKHFSLRAAPGSRIALVGASGCGKSTVGRMLAGLLSPWSGSICYDGIPIQKIPKDWLCGSLSVVGQNGEFFTGTIRENITMWRNEYPEKMLLRAVKDAEASELVNSFPENLEHRLEEGGRNLSGGQRQRLQIARALMTNPSILILDEATSALDTITEEKIMQNIRSRGCTCMIIAHRLSSIRDCDLIVVMDQGRVAEYGSHETLMQRQGVYSRLIADH